MRALNFFWLKFAAFCLALLPLGFIIILISGDHLGPDPAEKLSLVTGEWAIRFLLLTLLVSSLARRMPGLRFVLTLRRQLGLFAFFYAVAHLLVFVALYLSFDGEVLWSELRKRPYITVGMLALILMLPLAATSNQWMLKSLGATFWKRLHRLVYLCLFLVVVHVIWQVRSSWFDAVFYGVISTLILLERLIPVHRSLRPNIP